MSFLKLAKKYYSDQELKYGLEELTDFETKIVNELPNKPAIHG